MLTPVTSDEGSGEHQENAEIPEQGVNGPEEEEKPGTSEGLSRKRPNEHLAEEEKAAAAGELRYPVRSARQIRKLQEASEDEEELPPSPDLRICRAKRRQAQWRSVRLLVKRQTGPS